MEMAAGDGDVMKLNGLNFEQTVFRSGEISDICLLFFSRVKRVCLIYSLTLMIIGKNGMVKFYQSWCGHSIKMKP